MALAFNEEEAAASFRPAVRAARMKRTASGKAAKRPAAFVDLPGGGVIELLDALDGFGLPRAICTSSARETVHRHMDQHGLLQRFDVIVARGDAARGKPAPDPFVLAAQRLGFDPADCLALEDSHNGIRAAAGAGMMAVMVPDLLAPTPDIESLCVRIAADLHEVRDLIAASRRAPA